jgi:RNA-directed DNA polymerase
MRREFHVRFYEGPGVQFPRATRLVIVFEREDDARKVWTVLPKRFGKYGLTLHPTKTRLVPFDRPRPGPNGPGPTQPATFDLLGFTHYWACSNQGHWVVMLKTAKNRFTRALQQIADWCQFNRHHPVAEQHHMLTQKLRGHFAYFGIVGNLSALLRLRNEVYRRWRRWLNRRSQRARMTWDRMRALHSRYPLPSPPRRLRHLRT